MSVFAKFAVLMKENIVITGHGCDGSRVSEMRAKSQVFVQVNEWACAFMCVRARVSLKTNPRENNFEICE